MYIDVPFKIQITSRKKTQSTTRHQNLIQQGSLVELNRGIAVLQNATISIFSTDENRDKGEPSNNKKTP
jgi:muconolactone delta-isomerase